MSTCILAHNTFRDAAPSIPRSKVSLARLTRVRARPSRMPVNVLDLTAFQRGTATGRPLSCSGSIERPHGALVGCRHTGAQRVESATAVCNPDATRRHSGVTDACLQQRRRQAGPPLRSARIVTDLRAHVVRIRRDAERIGHLFHAVSVLRPRGKGYVQVAENDGLAVVTEPRKGNR